jgi:mono/diheme cytochrome c family protein
MRTSLAAGFAAALLAFGLVAITEGIGGGSGAERASAPAPAAPAAQADESSGRAVFVGMGCGSCHTLAAAGTHGEFGPNLDDRLPHHTRKSLIARIMARPDGFDDMSAMPTNFRDRLSPEQLDELVAFLLAARS